MRYTSVSTIHNNLTCACDTPGLSCTLSRAHQHSRTLSFPYRTTGSGLEECDGLPRWEGLEPDAVRAPTGSQTGLRAETAGTQYLAQTAGVPADQTAGNSQTQGVRCGTPTGCSEDYHSPRDGVPWNHCEVQKPKTKTLRLEALSSSLLSLNPVGQRASFTQTRKILGLALSQLQQSLPAASPSMSPHPMTPDPGAGTAWGRCHLSHSLDLPLSAPGSPLEMPVPTAVSSTARS